MSGLGTDATRPVCDHERRRTAMVRQPDRFFKRLQPTLFPSFNAAWCVVPTIAGSLLQRLHFAGKLAPPLDQRAVDF